MITDTQRLDWIEKQSTLHTKVDILYVVIGYQLELYNTRVGQSGEEVFEDTTVRGVIDKAMTKHPEPFNELQPPF